MKAIDIIFFENGEICIRLEDTKVELESSLKPSSNQLELWIRLEFIRDESKQL